ncbi:DUF3024 domain-containing protein [Rhodococcus opacus]|uniref:DUF3024 domain-containing protein n=1 Tax=Rhodococcus opacus TaxID=37919 RepID=UPI001B34AB3D
MCGHRFLWGCRGPGVFSLHRHIVGPRTDPRSRGYRHPGGCPPRPLSDRVVPIARLRYTKATKTWSLYWRDRG